MTLKVGETYKTRNGMAVRITDTLNGGLFKGRGSDWSEHATSPIVYRADGRTIADGWADWTIDGPPMVVQSADDEAKRQAMFDRLRRGPTGPIEVVPGPRAETDDRLDKLEAMCTDLFRQLRNMRVTVAEKATIDFVEGLDRRTAALRQGINQQGAAIAGTLHDLARIEDMLTTERDNKSLVDLGTGETAKTKIWANLSDAAKVGCMCDACKRERGEVIEPPKRVIKGGWLNVYEGDEIIGWETRERADGARMRDKTRIACIQIPDITEGEGL